MPSEYTSPPAVTHTPIEQTAASTTGVFGLSAGLWSSVFGLFVLTGCGSGHPAPTYPVTGKVVFSDDGTPLSTGGSILWESVPDEPGVLPFNASGAIQADGTFELTTFEEGDGAVAGEHRVLVRPKRPTGQNATSSRARDQSDRECQHNMSEGGNAHRS